MKVLFLFWEISTETVKKKGVLNSNIAWLLNINDGLGNFIKKILFQIKKIHSTIYYNMKFRKETHLVLRYKLGNTATGIP